VAEPTVASAGIRRMSNWRSDRYCSPVADVPTFMVAAEPWLRPSLHAAGVVMSFSTYVAAPREPIGSRVTVVLPAAGRATRWSADTAPLATTR
jgi:hypothetical protein